MAGPAPARQFHEPVMLQEVLEALSPQDGGIYVDATFGAGGYSRAILEAAQCTLWAIDRDPQAQALGEELAREHPGRLRILAGRFGDMDKLLAREGIDAVDGIVLDLGVSSMQLDQPERGFSFQADGPLDMRMAGVSADEPSCAEVLENLSEAELADILYRYGEERKARRIARAIVAARKEQPIERTGQLAQIVRKASGPHGQPKSGKKIDPATRSFQALRIYVNDELGELERGLAAAEHLLKAGGLLVVVSFHSLEDRIVKFFLRRREGKADQGSRHLPRQEKAMRIPSFENLYSKALQPTDAECRRNPRARSARLRAARRKDAPAWPQDPVLSREALARGLNR
jgi:16S rRNA (cytosine1402-N4)-methyltransferase